MKTLLTAILTLSSLAAHAETKAPSVYSITSISSIGQKPTFINGSDQLDCEMGHIRTYDQNGNFVTHIYFRSEAQCQKVESCLAQGHVGTETPIIMNINNKNTVRRLNGLVLPQACK